MLTMVMVWTALAGGPQEVRERVITDSIGQTLKVQVAGKDLSLWVAGSEHQFFCDSYGGGSAAIRLAFG
jgi:hypothetical protein